MKERVIVDTGPLVAALSVRDRFHDWAVFALGQVPAPLMTCEAVIVESCFLLRSSAAAVNALLSLLAENLIRVEFRLADEIRQVRELMHRYGSQPMSFADACLVRMAELAPASTVITLDRDFLVYRLHGRQGIRLSAPFIDGVRESAPVEPP